MRLVVTGILLLLAGESALHAQLAGPMVSTADAKSPISAEALYEKSSPSVFTIQVGSDSGKQKSLGSGFVVHEQLIPSGYRVDPTVVALAIRRLSADAKSTDFSIAYGLTNHHVLRSAAIGRVHFHDDVIGVIIDVIVEDSESDVALFSFAIPKPKVTTPLVLSQASAPKVGAAVFAIGSPQGNANTLSNGLVSAIRPGDPQGLQITAPISPGSSGGPLFNDCGEVIGITTATLTSGQNLNFAVMVDTVRRVLTRVQQSRPLWLGVSLSFEEDLLFERVIEISSSESSLSKFVDLIPQLKYGTILLGADGSKAVVAGLQSAASHVLSASNRLLLEKFASFVEGKIEAELFAQEVSQVSDDRAKSRLADESLHFKVAVAAFNRVLSDDRTFSPALDGLYGCYLQAGKRKESLTAAKLLARQVPYCADAIFNCAIEQETAGDIKGAIESLEQVLAYDPYKQVAAQSLATHYLGEEEYENAIRWYQHAIALSEAMPVGGDCGLEYFNLSIAFANLRKFRSAHDSLVKAREHFKRGGNIALLNECEKRIQAIVPLIMK